MKAFWNWYRKSKNGIKKYDGRSVWRYLVFLQTFYFRDHKFMIEDFNIRETKFRQNKHKRRVLLIYKEQQKKIQKGKGLMENVINIRTDNISSEAIKGSFYKLFWIYVICGTTGFCIETIWCWIDFQEFTSRTSNLFFPISCVWGVGGVLLYTLTVKNRWNHGLYIFAKCALLGAVFEFLCGYLGECMLEVTFWDYSEMPLHIGKYINIPFCLVWGLIGMIWVRKICPIINQKLKKPTKHISQSVCNIFLIFTICSQVLTGAALLRMHERQEGKESRNYIESVLDRCFTDQMLQNFFPKMKSSVTGEKIYRNNGLD